LVENRDFFILPTFNAPSEYCMTFGMEERMVELPDGEKV